MGSGPALWRAAAWVPLLAACSVPAVASAQQEQSQLPSRPQVEPSAPVQAPPPSRAVVNGDQAIAATDCPLDKYDVDITVQRLNFVAPDGSALPAELTAALAGVDANLPAGPQKVSVVCGLRDRATEALRAAHYIATVQIPPQRIEDGTLTLQVVTAHIVEVRVRGDAGRYRATLARRIEQLKALNPLNTVDAERILLLANDVPGLNVQLTLRPASAEPGAVIGDLSITLLRGRIFANVQNYGSRQLGRETVYARAELFGLTGASDLTYIGGQATVDFKEQKVLQAGHQMGIGNNGLRLALGGTYAWSRPSIGLLDLRAESLLTQIELSMPLLRSVRNNVQLAGGFEFDEQRTRVFSGATSSALNRDRTRALFARISGAHRELDGSGFEKVSLTSTFEVRKGLDIFASTLPRTFSREGYTPSRFEGDSRAWVLRGTASATVALGRIFSLGARAQGQWSDRPLLNLDEFSIGNLSVGRGYDPGANSGDHAVGLVGEVRAQVVSMPRIGVQLLGFYDSVWLWNLDTGAIETNRRLGSYGGGFRLTAPGLAQLDATYARPTSPALLLPGAKVASPRFLLSLTVQFAPRR